VVLVLVAVAEFGVAANETLQNDSESSTAATKGMAIRIAGTIARFTGELLHAISATVA
jgi:hypothetical protein